MFKSILSTYKFFCPFIIILFVINESLAISYWLKQQSPTTRDLSNCYFVNSNIGWIAGDSGTIIKTTNGGETWMFQNTGIVNGIESLFFINERLGWALAWEVFPDSTSFLGTKILKTTNGGNNWINYMYTDTSRFMRTIYFIDSLKGFMGGVPITIVLTTNAGLTWNPVDTDTTLKLGYPIEEIKFFNSQIGYAAGGFRDLAGAMWRTTNGGLNWRAAIIGPEPMTDLYIFNPNKTIAVGGDFEYGSSYVKTTDQGINWYYNTFGVFGVARAIDFRTPYEGWVSSAQMFVYTVDTGNTWTSIYTPDSIPIYDIDFSDSLHGWAVGLKGIILKYNSTIVSTHNNIESINPNFFILYQNYPNPFNPKTVITYYIPFENNGLQPLVLLKVYDVVGNEIETLVNQKQNSGTYTLKWDATNLPSGIYFYRIAIHSDELKAGLFSQTKKMLLLK